VQPDESGLDASPKFDPVWGRRANGRSASRCWCAATAARLRRRRGRDAAARCSARRWSTRSGRSRCRRWAPSATPALIERLWDERRGLFLDEAQPGGKRPAILTWAALARWRCRTCRKRSADAWSRSTLLDQEKFLTPIAPPSVAAREPSYAPGGGRGPIRRYLRGPTWVNAAWLLWLGLRRLGFDEAAERMANGLIGAVEREGLREYYDPRNGAGLGARDFAWSALIAELAEPDRQPGRAICSGR
jgi:glycogen debranching enzyme